MFKYNRKQFFLIATTLFLVVFLFSGCKSGDSYQKGYWEGETSGRKSVLDEIASGNLECPDVCVSGDYYKGFAEAIIYLKNNDFSQIRENENIIKACKNESFIKAVENKLDLLWDEPKEYDKAEQNYFKECLNNY